MRENRGQIKSLNCDAGHKQFRMTRMVKEGLRAQAELLTDGTRGIFFLKKLLILYWDIAD